ncbi:L,D-transpeptidase [Flavobacterium sp. NG2]|uniref:L,D-transpeptidase n=1 Tax=Flavobacterium sp. NG2 TaxID=3097547 RepID=UPI002A810F85|nr:L,D-transpeptidase [Flavobacterium sp. NG2]WPR72893.1 L,D-transpeptidase [Flavobacterium sp. NG2]
MKKSISLVFINIITLICILVLLASCKKNDAKQNSIVTNEEDSITIEHRDKLKGVSYQMAPTKTWLNANEKDDVKMTIVMDLNRTDASNIKKMDSIIIPTTFEGKREDYLPFPLQLEALKNISKIIFFSYPTQTFAAYKNGTLVYTGPTNMGREKDPTPTGLFFTNWKAEETTSTFNDEWELKWNFNIENKLGVGFHQYELPGYPASHSCLRLREKDARFLYDWADQWVLADTENIKAKGTPVIVFGKYDFKAPKPWLQMVKNPDALEISEHELANLIKLNLASIIKEQKNSKLIAQHK